MAAASPCGVQMAGYRLATRLDPPDARPRGTLVHRPAVPVYATTAVPPPGQRRQVWAVVLPMAASLAMVPWIFMLATTLPDRYVTNHWNVTWVGFDILESVSFAVTAWTAWRRHPAATAATLVSVTLLACDAWFTMTTISTRADVITSAITAAGGLPYAIALVCLRRPRRSPGPHGAQADRKPALVAAGKAPLCGIEGSQYR